MKKFLLTCLVALGSSSLFAQGQFMIDGIYYNLFAAEDGSETFAATVGTDALYDYETLGTELVLPDYIEKDGVEYPVKAVYSLAHHDFGSGSAFTKVTLPATVTRFGSGEPVFGMYNNLAEIVFTDTPVTFGENAFAVCRDLKSFVCPEWFTEFSPGMFSHAGLESIEIPQSITALPPLVFANCANLSEINLPASLKEIGYGALAGCALSELVIPEGVECIGAYAFAGEIESIGSSMPTSLAIQPKIFSGNSSSLKAITLPSQLTEIPDGLLYSCSGLETVAIPSGVTKIGSSAFQNAGIKELKLPDGVTSIGQYAFSGCGELTEFTIPAGVKAIGDYAFFGCDHLKELTYPTAEPIDGNANIFSNGTYHTATLKVVQKGVEKAKSILPWRLFAQMGTIELDGMDAISVDQSSEKLPMEIYNLQGMRVSGDHSALPAGIYIINGRKALIRN